MSRHVLWLCVVAGCSNLLGLSPPHEAVDAGDTVDAAAPDFQLAVATIHPRVPAGGSDVLAISVTRVGGFADDITVSVESPPNGLTVGAPVTVGGSDAAAAITVTGDASLAIGSKLPITVLGLAGNIAHQLPVDLPVTGLPGHLDPTYGMNHDGTVVLGFGANVVGVCEDLDVDPVGVVTYAGSTAGNGVDDAILGQLNPDGTLNGGFAHSSTVGTGIEDVGPAGTNSAPSLVQAILRNTDHPVVSGAVDVANTNAGWLASFNGVGSPDSSFGSGGEVFPAGVVQIPGLVAAGNGGLLFAATSTTTVFVGQVTAAGAPDASFNGGAPITVDLVLQSHQIAVDPSDPLHGFFIAGIAKQSQHARVERFHADGTPDTTFGTSGVAEGPVVVSNAKLVVQPDGKPVVACESNFKDVVTRFTQTGAQDASFATNGTFTGSTFASAIDVAVQADGKLLIVGTNSSAGVNIFRLTPDGALDPTYGSGGTVALGGPELFSVMLGADDTAFVCGRLNSSAFVARITR